MAAYTPGKGNGSPSTALDTCPAMTANPVYERIRQEQEAMMEHAYLIVEVPQKENPEEQPQKDDRREVEEHDDDEGGLTGEAFVTQVLAPRLFEAGLYCQAFYNSFGDDIIVEVFASPERLEEEAEKQGLKFPLNKNTLKLADKAVNLELQRKYGYDFREAEITDEKSKRSEQSNGIEIPKYHSEVPWLKSYEPYEHIYAPYSRVNEIKYLFFDPPLELVECIQSNNLNKKFDEKQVTPCGNFRQICRNVNALRLIRRIMQKPRADGGAALNLEKLEGLGTVRKVMPGTNPRESDNLHKEWLKLKWPPWDQPLDGIRHYMGEYVAMYFAFTSSYTQWLLSLGILGLCLFVYQYDVNRSETLMELLLIFSVITPYWAILFTEKWKRNEAVHSLEWGTTNVKEEAELRPAYIQSKEVYRRRDFVLGKPVFWKAPLRHTAKLLSADTVITMIVGILVIVVFSIFFLRVVLANSDQISEEWAGHISSIATAIQIQVMWFAYSKLAHFLVSWENHPTKQEHDDSLALKLSIFQMLNAYLNLFYVAFVKGNADLVERITGTKEQCTTNPDTDEPDCLYELQFQLLIIFVIRIALPVLKMKIKSTLTTCKKRNPMDYSQLDKDEQDLMKDTWTPFDDYLELMIQYGFVTLFISAFPLAPLLAFISNIIEFHMDSSKLLKYESKPFPRKVAGIGSWFKLLRLLSVLGLLTNLSLMVYTAPDPWFGLGLEDSRLRLAAALVIEHVVLATMFAISESIPEVPGTVRIQLKRQEFLIARHIQKTRTPDEMATIKDCGVEETRSPSTTDARSENATPSIIPGFGVGQTRENAISTLQIDRNRQRCSQ